MPMSILTAGFVLGFSLILAIGAQNAFVLRQGLRRSHVLAVVLTCAVSDALLIGAGVAGFGVLVTAAPWIIPVCTWGGAAFLAVYGAMAMRSAWTGGNAMTLDAGGRESLASAVTACLALTWLNPHVYLDTVVLLGSIAATSGDRVLFGTGAVSASFVFFFGLGYGARLLAPLFARPAAWRILDAIVGLTMWAIALKLVAA